MSIYQINKQREAAARLRDGEPDSMGKKMDSRPEHSPYASQVCAVYFQGNGPLHIPHALLHQSAELASRDVTTGCYSSSFCELHLNDIAYDTGHVLIHFLVTGRYQCLKPQGDTSTKRYTSEFTTALRVYAVAQSFQLPSLRDLARREMIDLGDRLSLPSLINIMEESSQSMNTLPGIAAYVESRILAFAENITPPTSEKMLAEIGTPNTLSMVLLKTILLLQASELSPCDESLRKEELVETLRGLTDAGPIAKGKASYVDRAMKEAEDQAAKRAEEKAAKEAEEAAAATVAMEQRIAKAQAAEAEAEAAREKEEIDSLLEKRARRKGKLLTKDRKRLSTLEYNAAKRAEARAARVIANAETAHAFSAPALDKVGLSEPSFTFPTPDGEQHSIWPHQTQPASQLIVEIITDDYPSVKLSADRDISDIDQPQAEKGDESFPEPVSSKSPSSNDNGWRYIRVSPSPASDDFELTG